MVLVFTDQWSPLNPEGQKKYDRDFLIGLKLEPQSTQRPDNLPDIISGLGKDPSNVSNFETEEICFIRRTGL